MTELLAVDRISVSYGGVRALTELSLRVETGEFVVLLGPNGAGKSTTLKAISGLVRASAGGMTLRGTDLTRLPAWQRVSAGIALVPEGRQIFADQTVGENLLLGAFSRRRERAELATTQEEVFGLFPRLYDRRRQLAGTLSGGEAQMLAVARALMSRPALLMLDEPSLGLAPLKVEEMFAYLARLHREHGLSVLLVEQQAAIGLRLADRGYVLERGRVAVAGAAADLRDDDRVRAAYLGA